MKNILFIVNPIAGKGKPGRLIDSIKINIDKTLFTYEFSITQKPGHATEIAKKASKNFDIIVAVGGDGTVNEVLNGIDESRNIMGIIPTGSGNGLANFLKIPKGYSKALRCINKLNTQKIDTMLVNGTKCINVAGVGFDGYVAKLFKESDTRGLYTYSKIVLSRFKTFNAKEYKMIVDGIEYSFKAFLISFANSSQFGNNAHIAPKASVNDGLIDITILEKIPVHAVPMILSQLFTKSIDSSKYYKGLKGRSITVISDEKMYSHIDGEYIESENTLSVTIQPLSLNIIAKALY